MAEGDQVVENHDWHESAPDWIKELPYFRPGEDGAFRPRDEITAAIQNAAKIQGNMAESHIKVPTSDMADADVAAIRERALQAIPGLTVTPNLEDADAMREHYRSLGVPGEADGYKEPAIEGFTMDEKLAGDLRAFAHENNWTQGQYAAFVTRVAGEQQEGNQNAETRRGEQLSALKDKLGEATERRLQMIASALGDSAPEGFVDAMKTGKVDAGLVLALDGLVQTMIEMGDEGNEFVKQAKSNPSALAPEEARRKAGEIWQQLQDLSPSNPEYKRLNSKRLEYLALAIG